MTMDTFTIVFEYDGGTYISQVQSQSETSAILSFAEKLDINSIKEFDQNNKNKLIESVKINEPVALKGLSAVWCTTSLINEKLGLIHVVRTKATVV